MYLKIWLLESWRATSYLPFNYLCYLEKYIYSIYIKMKITNIRSEDLVEIIINNDLTEDDKI